MPELSKRDEHAINYTKKPALPSSDVMGLCSPLWVFTQRVPLSLFQKALCYSLDACIGNRQALLLSIRVLLSHVELCFHIKSIKV
jgi:hypothetical protein